MEEGSGGGLSAAVGEAEQEEDGVMAAWLVVDDETTSELTKLLDLCQSAPPPVKVRFIDDPYSSAVIFQSYSAHVTINGNEESCGSSFSDSGASVMASVDLGGARKYGDVWGFWCTDESKLFLGASVASVADDEVELGIEDFLSDGGYCNDGGEDAMWDELCGDLLN